MDYSKLEVSDFVHMVLNNVGMCPCLMIGMYVQEFKKQYKDVIGRVYNIDNVRDLIDSYEGVTRVNSKFLVLDGVGYLSATGQNSLLKFIEESKVPIILL